MDEIYFRNSQKGNFKNDINIKSKRQGYCPNLKDSADYKNQKFVSLLQLI